MSGLLFLLRKADFEVIIDCKNVETYARNCVESFLFGGCNDEEHVDELNPPVVGELANKQPHWNLCK